MQSRTIPCICWAIVVPALDIWQIWVTVFHGHHLFGWLLSHCLSLYEFCVLLSPPRLFRSIAFLAVFFNTGLSKFPAFSLLYDECFGSMFHKNFLVKWNYNTFPLVHVFQPYLHISVLWKEGFSTHPQFYSLYEGKDKILINYFLFLVCIVGLYPLRIW